MKLVLERNIEIGEFKIQVCHTPETDTYTVFLPEQVSELPLFSVKSLETCYLILLEVVVPYIMDWTNMQYDIKLIYNKLNIKIQKWMNDNE